MNKAMKVGLGCGGLLIVFLLVSFGALLAYVIHEQHAYEKLPDTHDLSQRVAQLGEEYLAQRPHGALVIGVLQQDKGYIVGLGQASPAQTNPPDGQTIFELGSITKVFTGVTLAKLVDDGVVRLDDPIGKYLPEGVVAPQKNGHEITLGELATHTSGLPRLPDNLDTSPANAINPYASYHATNLYQSLATVQLSHEPGKVSDYSNYGFGLLGHLLELKTGLPYETLITRTICEPLGLSNTVIHLSPEQLTRLAPGHDAQGDIVSNWDFDALAGCGAFRSDASDLLNFLSANLKTNSAPIYQALAEARKFHLKKFSGGIGLGWQIEEPVEDRVVYWHNGGTGGYIGFIGFDRKNQAGIVILSNYGDAMSGDNSVDKMGMDILKLATKVSWQ